MDYRVYHLSWKEVCRSIALAGLLTAVVAYLFYASWLGIVFFPVFIWFFMKRQKKAGREQMQIQLAREFMDTLRSISAALLAGFSIENAWKEAEKEILALYGKRSYMYQEVKEMNCSISLNQPLEALLADFSARSGNMDIAGFSEVFSFAKRSGGNFVTIIDATSRHMRVRYETEREIQVQIASRKMEQKVMNVIPVFILAYLKVTSMDFLNVLYGNVAGALFMTACLAAYGGAIVLAEKIMTIHM